MELSFALVSFVFLQLNRQDHIETRCPQLSEGAIASRR